MRDITAGTTTPLKENREFRLLLRGSSASMLGSRVSAIAYPLLVLAMTGSPMIAGWASFAAIAPSILIYLPAGALVDRWDPRRAMLCSEFGRGTAIATIVVGLALHRMAVVELAIVGATEQILGVFSMLAERRFVRSLVQRDQATSALVRSEARTHIVVLLGRPLGGLLFGLGRIIPFVADAFSFAVSVGVLVRLGTGRDCDRRGRVSNWRFGHEIGGLVRDIGEGLRWLRLNPFAGIALPLAGGTTLVSQALIMVFIAESDTRHLSPIKIGIVLGISGAGGALGSAVASRLFALAGYYLLPIQMGAWMATLSFLAWTGGGTYQGMAIAMAVMGFSGALGNIALDTFVIRNAAETMLARVTSANRLITFGALALGPPLGGILFELCRAQNATWVLLILTACLLAAAFLASSSAHPESPLKGVAHSASSFRPQAQPSAEIESAHRGIAGAHLVVHRHLIFDRQRDEPGIFAPDVCQSQELRTEQERAVGRLIRAIGFVRIVMALLGPAYLIAAQERLDAKRQV